MIFVNDFEFESKQRICTFSSRLLIQISLTAIIQITNNLIIDQIVKLGYEILDCALKSYEMHKTQELKKIIDKSQGLL